MLLISGEIRMFSRFTAIAAAVACLAGSASADMKAKSRMSMQGMSFDSTNYVKGSRERREMNMMGMQTVQIYQCDLHRMAMINDKNRTYMVTDLGNVEEAADTTASSKSPKSVSTSSVPSGPGGVLTIGVNSTDTGERKDFFGYKARHVKTEMKTEATADAKCAANMDMKTDGWYIDFKEQQMICSNNPRAAMAARGSAGCPDKIRIKGSGYARMGYPVSTEMTMMANGQPLTMKLETLELSTITLEPSLFEIPAGYREVHDYKDLMGLGGIGGMVTAARMAGNAMASAAAANATSAGTSASSAKAAGKVRVGVVRFGNSSGQTVPENSLRDRLVGEIQQVNMEAVALDLSPSSPITDIEKAAKDAQCDYLLFTDVYEVKDGSAKQAGKKAFGGFLSRATGVDTSSATSSNGGYSIGMKYRLFAINDTKNAHSESMASSNEGTNAESSAGPALEREAMMVAVQVKKDSELRRRQALR
jgi:hypothetical protein